MAEGNWGSAGMHKVDIRNDLQLVEKLQRRAREGRKPFRGSIVPGGVYGGDGAIFAAENPIF